MKFFDHAVIARGKKESKVLLTMRLAHLVLECTFLRGGVKNPKLYFKSEDLWEVHHLDKDHQNHKWENLTLMHQHCHDQVHSGMHDKHPVVEEPCEVNVSSTVL